MSHALAFVSVVAIISGTIVSVVRTMAGRGRGAGGPELRAMDARLARIEQAVDAIAIEVERVAEGQRFTAALLADRTSAEGGERATPTLYQPR